MTIRDDERALVDRHVAALMEHFDAVRVFVSRYDGAEQQTDTCQACGGSWHASYGQVREWLIRAEEQTRVEVRRVEDES